MPQQPKIGEDVTALMPKVGEDVTDWMTGAPSQASTPKPPAPIDLKTLSAGDLWRSGRSEAEIMGELSRREREGKDRDAAYLPAALGALGGIVGGIPGAALGGVVGDAFRQVGLRSGNSPQAPQGIADQAKSLATEGAMQGAGQLAGMGLAAGAGKAATYLMNRATSRVSTKLALQFPELSQTLIDNAIAVSKGGVSKAEALLKVAKQKATAALISAEKQGATVPVQMTADLADSFKTALVEKAVKSGATKAGATAGALGDATQRLPAEVQALIAQVDDAAKTGSELALTPTQADLLKTQLQRESRALYANRVNPNGPNATDQAATLKGEFASRLNDALDALANGYKAANKDAQQFLLSKRGVSQAIKPQGNLMQAMVRPGIGALLGGAEGSRQGGTTGAIIGGVAGAAAMSPAGMSRQAIVLGNPIVQSALRQLPRSTAAALQQWLTELVAPSPEGQTPPTVGGPQ